MQNIKTSKDLKEAIILLEQQQSVQGLELKKHFFSILESIKPVNLIRSTVSQMKSSPDLLGGMLSTTVGLAAGYLSKKTLVGSSASLIKKLLGTLLQFGVTTMIVKNPKTVKSLGQNILHRIFNKKEGK